MQNNETPLYALHEELGAKLVDFAGYRLPLQYATGIKAEHRHTRSAAGLFDVSHMGQIEIRGPDCLAGLEALVPSDLQGLTVGRQRYTVLTNDAGGVRDDLVVTNLGTHLALVVNAATKTQDLAYLREGLSPQLTVELRDDRAMVALQGPGAESVLAGFNADVSELSFMHAGHFEIRGSACLVSRSGYTGGDGFEICLPAADAETLARDLLNDPSVLPVGLGARDTLRLEAGLCLYGNELNERTTPVEAGLVWLIAKKYRTPDATAARFPGAEIVLRQLRDGPARRRTGLRLRARAIARAGAHVVDAQGCAVGEVTSGAYSPGLDCPIAMAYIDAGVLDVGTALAVEIRGVAHAAGIVELPFVPHQYSATTTKEA